MLSHFPTWSVRKPDNTRADAVCKVGGAPIGWSRDWPVCALCSLPMSFLGQFTGDPLAPRLPVGHTLFLLDSWLTVSEGREALAAHAENFPGTVELDGDAESIANFCLDGIGFVMTHAGEPEIYFMINR